MATGAVLLVLKTFGIVLIVATLRWALGRVSVEQCRAALLRVGMPAALALPVAAKLWTIGAEGLVLSAYRGVIALALFVATALTCVLVAATARAKSPPAPRGTQHQSVALGDSFELSRADLAADTARH